MMLKTNFQYVLGWLVLLGAVHASQDPKPECITQAWVRAPDLAPNIILQGDARVKISAECPAVENVSLGLRFKERSFVKALRFRKDVKRLNPKPARFDAWNASAWTSTHGRFGNQGVKEANEATVMNKDRWIVREEERIVFETTQRFDVGLGNHGTFRDAVQDFSILVPSTNFPPALDLLSNGFRKHRNNVELGVVEWIYEYFAQISFANGTTKEISAGLTAFQPMHDPARAPRRLTSTTVGLQPSDGMRRNLGKSPTFASFSVEISADSGLMFSTGAKSHNVTAVVTRSGFARTFSAPLRFSARVMTDLSPKWAAEYHIPDVNVRSFMQTSVLRVTSDDGNQSFSSPLPFRHGPVKHEVTFIMPNPTSDEIQANEIVTTTSAPFTVSIDVDETHVTAFETYYHTLANSLIVILETQGERVDLDGPPREPDLGRGPQFEDDEEAWVPWKKQRRSRSEIWRLYTGRVPIVVRPASEVTPSQGCIHASTDTSGQTVLSDERGCRRPSLIHYLDEGARGPIFVDRTVVHELLAEDPAERELRAPILEPVTSSPPKGEELIDRYYLPVNPRKPLIYVGETWATKVVNKDQHKV